MAETVHLKLKAKSAEVAGDSSQTTLGRADTIECVYFDYSVYAETSGGQITGKRQYHPILIRKRIDKSTPLLLKAFTENQAVEGTFLFFRPNPAGDGTTEQFYTIEIKKAKISSIRNYSPDSLVGETASLPALEEVTFVFGSITVTYTNGGVTHEDTINSRGIGKVK